MKLYIAGPMTGIPDFNYPAFNAASDRLEAVGYDVLNPARRGAVEGWMWLDYMRPAIKDVADAEGVAILPGWEASRGATIEITLAQQLGLIVAYVDWWAARVPRPVRPHLTVVD